MRVPAKWTRYRLDAHGRLHDARGRLAGAAAAAQWARWARKQGTFGKIARKRAVLVAQHPPLSWIDRWRASEARRFGVEPDELALVDSSAPVGDVDRAPLPRSAYFMMTEDERAEYALTREWRSPTPDDALRAEVESSFAAHPEWGKFRAADWADMSRPTSWEVLQVRAPPGYPGEYVDDSWSGDGPLRNLAREIAAVAERDRWVTHYGGEAGDYGKIQHISIS